MEISTARLEASSRTQEYASGNNDKRQKHFAAPPPRSAAKAAADAERVDQNDEDAPHQLDDVI